jgi:hypothetical protein
VDIVVGSDAEEISWKIIDVLHQDATPYFEPGYYTESGFYSQDFLLGPGFYTLVMDDIGSMGTGELASFVFSSESIPC